MLPLDRAQYLQQMGIIAYGPRLHTEIPQPEPDSPIKLLFLLQSSTLDESTPEHQLLKKIMTAVGLPDTSMAICHADMLPLVLPTINKLARIVAFGSNLTVSLPKGSVETVTLTELQHNDSAKRQLWQELKAIKAAYGH